MSVVELIVVLSVVAIAILMGVVVADVHGLRVQLHAGLTARSPRRNGTWTRRVDAPNCAGRGPTRRPRGRRERRAKREARRKKKVAEDAQRRRSEDAARAERRRAKAEADAARSQNRPANPDHVRHLDGEVTAFDGPLQGPDIPEAPVREAPDDSERGRPTADLGVISSPAPSRGPSQAILPPPPAPPRTAPPPSNDTALRAAGLQEGRRVDPSAAASAPGPHRAAAERHAAQHPLPGRA